MTFEQITQIIKENGGVDGFATGDFDRSLLPEYKTVYSKGDCEGGGDYSEYVYHFIEADVYLQVTGHYSSYEGTDWNEKYTQVFPKEKQITVYE